ncbi:MAG: tRNA (adenosine(37)-N6)-threonylcarbamoyltransferase complex ATPase subunit type 1 TsaE, partial [Bacteroidetes bacterium]|nr:tRNA (adenosine(37)-N6)-threonylcarbamoyltransferase complex ATPase subunit type 1 TsaE [Bacteroidota bacterium]
MTLSDAAKLRVESEGPDETISIGEQLAEKLQAGDVVAIYGELGSGKTQLVKGICRYFGIDEQS